MIVAFSYFVHVFLCVIIDTEVDNFPRRVPLELFDDESLKRLDLLDEKEQNERVQEASRFDRHLIA